MRWRLHVDLNSSTSMTIFKTANGKISKDIEEVKSTLREFIAELFSDERPDLSEIRIYSVEGQMITKDEVKPAIAFMKRGKAVGEDGIDMEVI